MKLGMDSYSLRSQGWTAFQFLDFAAQLSLDSVQFSGRQYFASLDPDYLRSVKRYADERGIGLEVGIGSFDRFAVGFRAEFGSGEEQLIEMMRAGKVLGSSVVRCFLGAKADRTGAVSLEQHVAECVRTLEAVAPVARDLGIKLAVENHGGVDLLARELRALVEEAGPDYVGVCLDTGNPAYAGEDPLLTTEILAPYTVSSHVRDNRVWATAEGATAQWVPLGEGNTDLRAILAILAERAPDPVIQLEIITGTPPEALTYNDPESEFWKQFPNMLARDFARFLALASTGQAEPLAQLMLPPGRAGVGELSDDLKEQQRRHFAESTRYAQQGLGIGERWRG